VCLIHGVVNRSLYLPPSKGLTTPEPVTPI
jgi:hypothetical protein